MAIRPAKFLSINLALGNSIGYIDNGGPWTGYPYKWEATLLVTGQPQGSDEYGVNPFYWTGDDVIVGDCIATSGSGALMRITAITSQDAGTVVCEVEDWNYQNVYEDQYQSGAGSIPDGDGYLFEVSDGFPILHPIPVALAGSLPPFFAADLIGRFFGRKLFKEIEVDQTAHGFAVGDLLYVDATGYHKALADDPLTSVVAGVVTEAGIPDADRFRYRPIGSIVEGITMPAGDNGILVYLSDTVPGGMTTTAPAIPVATFIKLSATSGILISGQGSGGGSVNYLGDWEIATEYKEGDIVNYNGVAYIAVDASTGEAPPSALYWNALGGGIGAPEVGTDYVDGLFTDFTQTTRVGIAVDRFNKIVKALGPKEAPALADIEDVTVHSDYNGVDGKLSFGASGAIAGYTNVGSIGGAAAVDRNASYLQGSVAGNRRLGIFNATTPIEIELAGDVVADPNGSFPEKSFGKADQGSLLLFINSEGAGTEIVSLDLTSDTGALSATSAGGSEISVSASADCLYPNGDPMSLFRYRTGTVTVGVGDQRNGWNWIKVIHRISSDSVTNYVEWVVDNDVTNIGLASHNFTLTGGKSIVGSGLVSLTGVKYFTAGSATFNASISNGYRNTFSLATDGLYSSNENGTNFSLAIPNLVTDQTDNINLTQPTSVSVPKLLNGAITVRPYCRHPLLQEVALTADATDNILLFNVPSTATYLKDNFRAEYYRLENGDYADQSTIGGFGSFNSTTLRTAGTVANRCLIQYDECLAAPGAIGFHAMPFGGDFTQVSVTPASNANYSALPSTTLFYTRRIYNDYQGSWSNFTLTLKGEATLVVDPALLDSNGGVNNNVLIEVRMPEQIGGSAHAGTGWMTFDTVSNGGCRVGALVSEIDEDGAKNQGTMGTVFCANGESLVLRVTAHSKWTGFLSELQFQWGLQ